MYYGGGYYAGGTPGPTGSVGASGNSFTWRNVWATGNTYTVRDVVFNSGASYICIQNNGPPATGVGSTLYWNVMVS